MLPLAVGMGVGSAAGTGADSATAAGAGVGVAEGEGAEETSTPSPDPEDSFFCPCWTSPAWFPCLSETLRFSISFVGEEGALILIDVAVG